MAVYYGPYSNGVPYGPDDFLMLLYELRTLHAVYDTQHQNGLVTENINLELEEQISILYTQIAALETQIAALTGENEHVTDENKRLDAKNLRLTDENERVAAENLRLTDENVRLAAENQRMAAENQRLTQTHPRAHAPPRSDNYKRHTNHKKQNSGYVLTQSDYDNFNKI